MSIRQSDTIGEAVPGWPELRKRCPGQKTVTKVPPERAEVTGIPRIAFL